MDLLNARKKAIELSQKEKRKQYIIVDEQTGECSVNHAPLRGTIAGYLNGAEFEFKTIVQVPEKKVVTKPITKTTEEKAAPVKAATKSKTENKVETKVKSKPTKKVAAKKVAAKKATNKVVPGKKVNISIADMITNSKKGFVYRDPQGVRQSVEYMKGRANQEYVREGMYESKEAK